MIVKSAAERHAAAHAIDDLSCEVVDVLRKMLDPAYDIGIEAELNAVKEALIKLHARATEEHTKALREMNN